MRFKTFGTVDWPEATGSVKVSCATPLTDNPVVHQHCITKPGAAT